MKIDIGDIKNLQNKTKLIRQTFGFGIKDFADLLGVTRQTVYNIENHKKVLTQTQYLAIRALIDMATKEQPEKERIVSTILSSNYSVSEKNDDGFVI